MSRRVRDWCDVCRDTEPDVKCTSEGCGRKFHESCLRTLNLWDPSTKRDEFICPDCKEANVNDGTCYICKKELYVLPSPKKKKPQSVREELVAEEEEDEEATEEENETGAVRPRRSSRLKAHKAAAAAAAAAAAEAAEAVDVSEKGRRVTRQEAENIEGILLCDGCSNSAHKECLGLASDALMEDDELWFCTDCDPNGETAQKKNGALPTAPRPSNGSISPKSKLGGNVDICYVCQKGGKLLGCDFCEQSYHPRCIDSEYLEFEQQPSEGGDTEAPVSERWRCPLCKGEDPLKSMSTRRLSRTAMLRMQKEMQTCIQQQHRNSKANRDRFLWASKHALKTFMTERAMNRLSKMFGGTARKRIAESSDETEDESGSVDGEQSREMQKLELDAVKAYRTALKCAKNGLLKEGVQLKPYQVVGVGWLLHSFFNKAGAILADEMGLGKTVQCLGFISALKAQGITGPHLIVVPLSTVGNWAREIRRFVPHLKFVKICGSRFERDHIMADFVAAQGLHDLYITTYETVVTEESFFCDNFDWQCIILDEAHRIKNQTGRIRHSLDRVSANMRVLLTGTPLQNNIKELFTLLNFLFPEVLEHSDNFEKAFLKGQINNPTPEEHIEETIDKHAMDAVSHLLSKMMLRRTKDLVVRLPRKIEHDIWLPLSPTSAYWYSKLLDVSDPDVVDSQPTPRLLGTVIKMRICTCHPKGLVTKDEQFKKFKEMFINHPATTDEAGQEIEQKGRELKALAGLDHIRASSKLVTMDRLLLELHLQNMDESASYRRAFEQNLRDLYVQAHPLPPVVAAKSKPVAKRRVKKLEPEAAEVVKSEKSETDSAAPAGEEKLTARQVAEKARRERQALATLQQKELNEKCELVVQETIREMEKYRQHEEWLREAMLPGQVSDAPIPVVKALLDHEDALGDETPSHPGITPSTPRSHTGIASQEDEKMDASSERVEESFERMEEPSSERIEEEEVDEKMVEEQPTSEKMEDTVSEKNESPDFPTSSEAHETGEGTVPGETMAGEETTEDVIPVEDTAAHMDVEATPVQMAKPMRTEEAKVAAKRIPHKVLVFTQFQLVLDELEAYCKFRGFKYLRLDGSTNKMIRELDIREFNSPDSSHLVYLICTRAGGVGINLVTANHVVLYDEDWNPFQDLQAIDRAHRIGQKREVHVWKLVTEWTVEERMAFRRLQKLRLDKLFIQANNANQPEPDEEGEQEHTEKFSVDEIRRLLRYGREAIKAQAQGAENVETMSLQALMNRPRRDLPPFEDGSLSDVNVVVSEEEEEHVAVPVDAEGVPEGSEIPTVNQSRACTSADDETVVTEGPGTDGLGTDGLGADGLGTDGPGTDGPGEPEGEGVEETRPEGIDLEEAKRSRRLRRRVLLSQAPVSPTTSKSKQERKVIHDKRCFRCGCGNNAMDENADPLVACHTCPRVYHMKGCLGLDAPPRKTWVWQPGGWVVDPLRRVSDDLLFRLFPTGVQTLAPACDVL
ncbi:putative SNF2 family protein [Gregarina niphandrodes]|uniref:SNF2 family protein n=1 Tax=Gregarina niphandrodes TaxID=110365 RepID=A0A023BAE8_GRENI|nr:putative SNF2 family protein [Gregarina niphandrodes]EZG78189.1 putative SNF2 family protein [Gregarina niphandrodes]|eukprot:XP_011129409.1 putative SNF2 family protein [Gregarina niphandrodes]